MSYEIDFIKSLIEIAVARRDSTQAALMVTTQEPIGDLLKKIEVDLPTSEIEVIIPHQALDAKTDRARKMKADWHKDHKLGKQAKWTRHNWGGEGFTRHQASLRKQQRFEDDFDLEREPEEVRWDFVLTFDEAHERLYKNFDEAQDNREMFLSRLDQLNKEIKKGKLALEGLRETIPLVQNPSLMLYCETRDALTHQIKRAIHESEEAIENDIAYAKEVEQRIITLSQDMDGINEAIRLILDGREGTTIEEIILADRFSVSFIHSRKARYTTIPGTVIEVAF